MASPIRVAASCEQLELVGDQGHAGAEDRAESAAVLVIAQRDGDAAGDGDDGDTRQIVGTRMSSSLDRLPAARSAPRVDGAGRLRSRIRSTRRAAAMVMAKPVEAPNVVCAAGAPATYGCRKLPTIFASYPQRCFATPGVRRSVGGRFPKL